MKAGVLIIISGLLISCANTAEVAAPCTFDDRVGCGELIYEHGGIESTENEYINISLAASHNSTSFALARHPRAGGDDGWL